MAEKIVVLAIQRSGIQIWQPTLFVAATTWSKGPDITVSKWFPQIGLDIDQSNIQQQKNQTEESGANEREEWRRADNHVCGQAKRKIGNIQIAYIKV